MRFRTGLIFSISVVLLFSAAGCGNRQAVKTVPGSAPAPTSASLGLVEPRTYVATFGDVSVTLVIPSSSEEAEHMRWLMSQYPPYLVGEMTVENTSGETVHFYDFAPVLVYSDGTRYTGASDTLFETDMIAPGDTLSALFRFGESDFEGLEEVVIERTGGVSQEAVRASP